MGRIPEPKLGIQQKKPKHLQLEITSIYQHISIRAEAMLSGGDGEQQEVLLGYDWADWTHCRRETAVYTALSEAFFLQLFSTSFRGGKKKKVLLKMMFHRNVLNSAIFSKEEGETLWRRCYTEIRLFAFVLHTMF